ncbi:MAG: REP-associated tyrosine transposase [Pseudomonadota bacterium]|nr:REP-associated tyrosine transposase [Pseudomonadota bacterium]
MPDYRRAWYPGGTYFFTVNALVRHNNDLFVRHIDVLRMAVARVKHRFPFIIHGWVVLPDHMHCIIELPQGDMDYATRWRQILTSHMKRIPF